MKEKMRIKKSGQVVLWVATAIFSVYAFTLIYPYFWLLINTLKNNGEYLNNSFAFPVVWRFENYVKAFSTLKVTGSDTQLLGMFFNSLVFSLAGSIIGILLSSLSAYIVAKYKFVGRELIYSVAIFTMIVPIVGSLPAQYKLVSALNLKNNLLGITILYGGPFGYNFLMLYGAFKSLSWEYAESAMIDGCNKFRIYAQIMMPLVAPLLTSLFVIQFIGVWNDYTTPMLYLKKMPTLSYGLYMFEQNMRYRGANYPIYFAAVIMALLPILAIFIAFQKILMENTVAGGLKG